MNAVRAQFGSNSRDTMRYAAVLCLVLLALLSVVQVMHVHAVAADADHCQLCIAIHSVVPLLVMAAALLLIKTQTSGPALQQARPVARYWQSSLFIRPPPAGR